MDPCAQLRLAQALIPTRGVSHCGLAIYMKKYLKTKERIMETQILFHHAKI
jgi:hypothetical protein